jgi:hypothetical protein
VAGHAGVAAAVARAAVDRGDHAQRQVQVVQHRALLDVHLHIAQVVGRAAAQAGDGVQRGGQAGGPHGLAHGDALGVRLVQPGRVELADQRARAQEGGLVALAFLFGKGHQLDAEGQAPALAVQLAHGRQRDQDAQPAVVLAAVAHGVVVAAGQQARGTAVAAVVDAHHIAHRVPVGLVEAGLAHPLQQLGGRPVGRREVGDGELAALGKARLAVRGQGLGPVPDLVAQHRLGAELVVQADLGDAVDVAQALGELELLRARQAPGEGVDDLLAGEAGAARAATARMKGQPKRAL